MKSNTRTKHKSINKTKKISKIKSSSHHSHSRYNYSHTKKKNKSISISSSSSKTKNKKKDKKLLKYYDYLNFKNDLDCQKKQLYYNHPDNKNLNAVFPFILDYNEANEKIFNILLPQNTGLTIDEWLGQYGIITRKCSNHVCHHHHHHEGHHHHKVDLFEPIKQDINNKLQSAVYELISSRTIINTFNYLYQKFAIGIYIQIKDGQINHFVPFINNKFVNNWSNLIDIPSKYKNLADYYSRKDKEYGSKSKYTENKDFWTASNCLINTEQIKSINDTHWAEIYNMLNLTCNNHKIDDVEFFINLKSFPVLRNDFTEPFNYIYGEDKFLTSQYYSSYHPILSISSNENFGDLIYPSAEDWRLITQEYFRNECQNKYLYPTCKKHKHIEDDDSGSLTCHKHNLEWIDKISKGYFIGDTSGCGLTTKDNIRLKLMELGMKNKDLLEINITRFSKRDKLNENTHEMDFHYPSKFKFNVVGNKSGFHGKFKYLISVPSYTIDYDLPYFLSLGGLVFKVENEYQSWYDRFLKPYQHYLPIKKDLSNLITTINWANNHLDVAEKIARNGNIVYKKCFNQKNILEYWNYLLNSIAHHRLDLSTLDTRFKEYENKIRNIQPQLISPPNININFEKDKLKKYKLGIIIPYYKLDKQYKEALKDITENLTDKLRKIKDLDFKIIICEQKRDNKKFNKGQLINLGLLIAKEEGCSHVVINNLNIKITDELIAYYLAFREADKGCVNIGFNWNEHYQKKYFTDICLWKLDLLFKLGGYPNNIWGWGCADKILYHRLIKYEETINKEKDKEKVKDFKIMIPILKNKLDRYDLNDWGQIIDPLYQNLKIIGDWYLDKYDDLEILEKYLKDIIKKEIRKNAKCSDTTHLDNSNHTHNHSDIKKNKLIKEGTLSNSENIEKVNLKILDKHQHQKEVEHYTFKLLYSNDKNIIE